MREKEMEIRGKGRGKKQYGAVETAAQDMKVLRADEPRRGFHEMSRGFIPVGIVLPITPSFVM